MLKPKITLNYGNSPYGEIMKASNIADSDKQKAKERHLMKKNIYKAPYIPNKDAAVKIKSSTGNSTTLRTNIDAYSYRDGLMLQV